MNDRIISDFKNPACEFRGAPFWAWNGKLDQGELRRQIRVMHKMGLGGFFMHSRVGLDTPYLSEEWFDCVRACIDEAEKLDMNAWLYDEDRWPSGAAGGLVTSDPKYRARKMVCEIITDLSSIDTSFDAEALYLAKVDGNKATALRRIEAIPAALADGDALLRFRVRLDEPNPWYNGGTYLDTISKEAVGKFIEVTHEKYKSEISEHFGGRVPGIFTDEPNYGAVLQEEVPGVIVTSWTDTLPEEFAGHYGYDIRECLPELFFDVEGSSRKTRFNYIDCITRMFVEAFGKMIGEWCEENNLAYTGHLLEEDTLKRQTFKVGNCMRFYEYMQAPGIDLLTEHLRIYDVAKQVSSVAHQFDRQWRLTETYGCTGWDFPFLGHKSLGDWQAALGINLRCQHLSWYTMQGQAKRDYPASIFYQSPWWEQYGKVEDYFARINLVMNKGEEIRELLYIHPVESTWIMFKRGYVPDEACDAFDRKFVKLRDCLLQAHLDFDYGDEDIMSRHGSVGMVDGQPVLRIAKAAYKAVVVPEMLTIRKSTLELLKEFAAKGGKVVFSAPAPGMMDVETSTAPAEFAAACQVFDGPCGELVDELEGSCRRVSICGPDGAEIEEALYLLREDKDSACLFICNTGTKDISILENPLARDLKAEFPVAKVVFKTAIAGKVIEMNPDTGTMELIEAVYRDGCYTINTSFPVLGSRLFAVLPEAATTGMSPAVEYSGEQVEVGDSNFEIALTEDNVLPLDRPEYRLGDGEWQDSDYILYIDHAVRDHIGKERRGGRMNQPWTREKVATGNSARIELKYRFKVDFCPASSMRFGIESPELYSKILINGNPFSADSVNGWWCDMSLKTLPVDPAYIKLGENEIVLECVYDSLNPGFECVYLLGDFGISRNGLELAITKPVSGLKVGDWGEQGLDFYSGSVIYHTITDCAPGAGERCFVRVPDFRAPCLRVMVNGVDAGKIAWAPFELDITDYLSGEENRIDIEVFGSRRNSHGPLYMDETWPDWTGPGQFEQYTAEYKLVPSGLMAPPQLVLKTIK